MRRDVVSTDCCEVWGCLILLHCILFLRLFAAMSGPHFCNFCKNHGVLTRVSHFHRQNCPWRECICPPCSGIRRRNEFRRSINRATTSTTTSSPEAGLSGLGTVSAAAVLSTANAATVDGSATSAAAARAVACRAGVLGCRKTRLFERSLEGRHFECAASRELGLVEEGRERGVDPLPLLFFIPVVLSLGILFGLVPTLCQLYHPRWRHKVFASCNLSTKNTPALQGTRAGK